MSQRHNKSQTSAVPLAREERKSEHRRVRHKVRQDLHVASTDGDLDDLALDRPHPTHGYRDEVEEATPRTIPAPPNRLKHWKQTFWKRRTNERRRKAQEIDGAA